MNYKKLLFILFFIKLCASQALSVEQVLVQQCDGVYLKDGSECYRLRAVKRFSELDLPEKVSKDQIRDAIQSIVTHQYGNAYRHIGISEDFYHGHIILNPETQDLLGLLFHTQETMIPFQIMMRRLEQRVPRNRAGFVTALYNKNGLLHGLNKRERSWIYFFNTRTLELATQFIFDEKPLGVDQEKWDGQMKAYTASQSNIDPSKLGFYPTYSGQINFNVTDCERIKKIDISNLNLMKVSSFDNEDICLSLFTSHRE